MRTMVIGLLLTSFVAGVPGSAAGLGSGGPAVAADGGASAGGGGAAGGWSGGASAGGGRAGGDWSGGASASGGAGGGWAGRGAGGVGLGRPVAVGGPVVAAPGGGVVPLGAFGWPLAGFPAVLRPFDPPELPYGRGHRGVDLGGWDGQPVLAAGDGVVAFAGMVAGKPVVSVDHPNGLRTTYEPVLATVTAGQRVARGDPIGTLRAGHAGCVAAACLHWGVRCGDEYLDPLWLLSPGPVRLLPTG